MATVLVPLADGCEELEAVTIVDILRRAGIDVVTAGLDDQLVRASHGVRIMPDTNLDEALTRDYDMVVLPGGLPGADNLNEDPRIKELLKKMANSERFTAAICAAPKVLANAGLLRGKKATAYPGSLDSVNHQAQLVSGEAVVRDGKVITSRGPGTAMDFALALIEALTGKAKRDEVERALVRP